MSCRKCRERELIDPLALQRVIEEILRRIEIDDFFQGHENCSIKIVPPTPRPLVIRKSQGRIVVIEDDTSEFITTKCESSGPHAEFEVLEDGSWAIAFLREEYKRHGKKAIEYIEGCRTVRPIRQRRQQKFAAEWSRNLIIRHYPSGTLRYARKW
jgi:hypothetical protein